MRNVKQSIRQRTPVFFKKLIKHIRFMLSKRYVNRLIKNREVIFLEVGAGSKKGRNGWVTMDIISGCDICWDLTKKLPFPDNSVHKIYSSHLLEHFTFQEGQKILDECYRILIPDGIFSICVPNARAYIEAYIRNERLDDQFFQYKPAYNNTSRIDYVNHIAYMDGQHKYMFDEENLLYLLKKKGFVNVRLRSFDEKIDMPERKLSSIYAEARKQ